jgi:hypothetical protein
MGLSGSVQAAVEEASNMVEELVARIRMQSAGTAIETQRLEALQ